VNDKIWVELFVCLSACVRRVSVLLGSVLHDQHQQRHLHPLRPVRRQRHLSNRPDRLLAVHLAGLRQQLPQSAHIHHLQQRVPTRLQQPTL